MQNPRVIFIKGAVLNDGSATLGWINKFLSSSGLCEKETAVEQVSVIGESSKVLRVVVKEEKDVQHIMHNKSKLRHSPEFKHIYVDVQRSYAERQELYRRRMERKEGAGRRNNVRGHHQAERSGRPGRGGESRILDEYEAGYQAALREQDHLNSRRRWAPFWYPRTNRSVRQY